MLSIVYSVTSMTESFIKSFCGRGTDIHNYLIFDAQSTTEVKIIQTRARYMKRLANLR